MEKETNYEWTSEEVEERNKSSKELFTHCAPRCPRCQGVLSTMEVHGHEQCVLGHAVIEDCCQGAQLK